MKKTLLALIALSSVAQATVVNLNSGSGASRQDFLDNSGAPLIGGTAFIGSFSGGSPIVGSALTPDDLFSSFSVVESPNNGVELTAATGGPPTWPDIMASVAINNVAKTEVPSGSAIDLLVIDTSDIQTARQALIFRLDANYEDSSVATPQAIDYNTATGTLFYGGGKFQAATLVPEPSAALLGGLALFGGLLRRRR
jgi:hypothetical protein